MEALSEPVGLDFEEELEEEEVDYDMEEEVPAAEEEPAALLQDDEDTARAEAEKKAKAPISWKAWKEPEGSDMPSYSGQDRSRRRSRDRGSKEERQSKDRKGSERQRSKDRGSREGRVRAVPAETRRTVPVESPPSSRVVQIRRSPSRERLVQEHHGNGILLRRSGSPPGIRRRSRSPLGVRRMSRSPLGIRRRPRSPLPARHLERFRTPPIMRRAAPSTLAPRYVDARERSPPPQRILVEIDPRDLPPGGLEYRGEHLMPRLARLPELLDYQYRSNRAPRIIYDSGPRRDLDERLPPSSRFMTFEDRERMARDRDFMLDRHASDLDRVELPGHLGPSMDRPAYYPGWHRSPERQPGLLRERSPPVRREFSSPPRHASAERLSAPNGLANGGSREGGLARREGRRKATGFSSPITDQAVRARRDGGEKEQSDPSSKQAEKKTAGGKEGHRKEGKQSAAAKAQNAPKIVEKKVAADKSRSKDEKAASKEGRPSSTSAKTDARPAKQEAQQPGGDAKATGKSSQIATEDPKRKVYNGKESAAAKPSTDLEKASAAKPVAKHAVKSSTDKNEKDKKTSTSKPAAKPSTSKPAAKPNIDGKKAQASTDTAKAGTAKPAAKPSADQGKPAESSAQANGKHQTSTSKGATASKVKEPSKQEAKPASRSTANKESDPPKATGGGKHDKDSKATATPRAVPNKPSSSRRDDKPAMEPKTVVASDGKQPGRRAVAGKPARRAEPIASTAPAKRPRTQASLPLAALRSSSGELPMPPMENLPPIMPQDHALQIPPTNLPLPPHLAEGPFVPGIASGLPLPPPPPLRAAQRPRLSGHGPAAGSSHPDSEWSDEDVPVQHMVYGHDRRVQEVGVRHVQEGGRRRPFGHNSPGRPQAPRQVREVRHSRFPDRPKRRSPLGLAATHPDMFSEWFYLDPQGVTHGPHSKWQLRAWLTQLANANDPDRHKAFCDVHVWRRDWPASNAVQLLQLLNG